MAYEQIRNTELAHNVILEGRERLSISGVEDVESFDENSIIIYTSKGTLAVHGKDMRIEKLSVDLGELTVEGEIEALQYEDEVHRSGGFWHRLFR
ncbi:MAG: sporulation protein YabP [Clostridiales bacterium]|nr:sporulation protein YabP [Clostridiales bacterium]